MNKVYYALADCESFAREIIEDYMSRIDGFILVASCKDGDELYSILQTCQVELLFLDQCMIDENLIMKIKTHTPSPAIVITTSSFDLALDNHQLFVQDHLHTPISFPKFLDAIDKYLSSKKQHQST